MHIIKACFVIEAINGANLLLMESAGRICYQSESKGEPENFLRKIIKSNHTTILEHNSMSVRFISDRGFTHELVRHRIAAFSQESTRYCNYDGEGIAIIHPDCLTDMQRQRREDHFWNTQAIYEAEISEGQAPQIARGVLPTALKTEILMTANFREWRHVFNLRAVGTTGKPHPQMKELMVPLLAEVKSIIPVVFDDILI